MHGVGEPAVVPDSAGTQHAVELGLLTGLCIRIIKRRSETHALQGALGETADDLIDFGLTLGATDALVEVLSTETTSGR